jgi:hypothetical protein
MHPAVVQVLFLLCATALELHLALMVVTPNRYLRCWQQGPAPVVSRRMRLFCTLLFLLILSIQYRLLQS